MQISESLMSLNEHHLCVMLFTEGYRFLRGGILLHSEKILFFSLCAKMKLSWQVQAF